MAMSSIIRRVFGTFESTEEFKKFGLLGLMFGFIIGVYWALRPIKDGIFFAMVGGAYQPSAKMVSLLLIIPLVILYGKLIDKYPRHKVFYGLIALYGLAALVFAWIFFHPELGLANKTADVWRLAGWAWYIYVESFGSIIVATFWAFTTDITSPESAQRGFPLIALLGQFGNIIGPWLLRAERWQLPHSGPIVGVAAALMFCVGLLLWVFMKVIPQRELTGYQSQEAHKETEPGFLEGLKLLLTQPYLLGIFAIITIYEVIVTIFDYYLKSESKLIYIEEAAHSSYLAEYAVWTGIVAFACVLFGINNIQRLLGMTASLVMMPILVAGAVVMLKFMPSLQVAFWIMVVAKAVNYALNQPTLKQVYIPTTRDVKYKAQAWIEMFGGRGSKAGGSYINIFRDRYLKQYGYAAGITAFLTMSSLVSLGLIVLWLFASVFVARKYNEAIAENKVVC